MTTNPLRHVKRLDIQGLRAIAVLAVMIAHAGLPMESGFIGVDMFFVISGFIITWTLLREEREIGRISLRDFYVRRFLRLAPALSVTVVSTVVLASLFLSPLSQQVPTIQVALGATFMLANWVLSRVTADYFAADAAANALTHTWSLSVEEQFYLVFPWVLITLLWWRRRSPGRSAAVLRFGVLAGLALVSLALIRGLPGLGSGQFPLGYYGSLNRAWEFLAGVLLAWCASWLRPRTRWQSEILGAAGLVVLVAAFVLIDERTPFPGKMTLLPVVGTALLLWAGLAHGGVLTRLLSTRPLAAIGDWSYSLYLWHWPLVVVARTLWPFVWWAPLAATVLAFVPGYLSYRFVEQTARRVFARGNRAIALRVATTLGASCLAIALTAGAFWWGWKPDAAAVARQVETEQSPELQAGERCPFDELQSVLPEGNGACRVSRPGEPVRVAVIGDSHSEVAYPGFVTGLPDTNVALFAFRSPRPFGGPEGVEAVLATLRSQPELQTVVVVRYLGRSNDGLLPTEAPFLRAVTEDLTARGVRVVVLDDVPIWPTDVYRCAVRRAPAIPGRVCGGPVAYFNRKHDVVAAQLDEALTGTGAIVAPSHDVFCTATTCRMAEEDGRLLYSDGGHVTRLGADVLFSTLMARDRSFAEAMNAARRPLG